MGCDNVDVSTRLRMWRRNGRKFKFLKEPCENGFLIVPGRSAYLCKQVDPVRLWHACVLQALIAIRAYGPQIFKRIGATLGFIHYVSHCEADSSARRKWVRIAGG